MLLAHIHNSYYEFKCQHALSKFSGRIIALQNAQQLNHPSAKYPEAPRLQFSR